jgi:Fe-S-cluster containining protein
MCCGSFQMSMTYEETVERGTALFGVPAEEINDLETLIDMIEIVPGEPNHYTCNRYDKTAMLCTRYDERPAMCRLYPSDSGCRWCTYDPRHPEIPGIALSAGEKPG